jgi:V8-like Glu-specific endopeptidase
MLRPDGEASVAEHSHRASAEGDSPAAHAASGKLPYIALAPDVDVGAAGGEKVSAGNVRRAPANAQGKDRGPDSKRAAPQETGNRIRPIQHPAWSALSDREGAAFPAALSKGNAGKIAVSTNVDRESLEEYARLARLPAIEQFFFPVPETVCLPDERTQVLNTTSAPWSANCQLVITIAGNQQAIGTGWLMGPRLVVTAGHCVHEGMDGNFFESVEVIPGMNGPARPYGSQAALQGKLRASDGWRTSGTLALDYGAILLDSEFQSPTGTSPGQFAVDVLSDAQLTGIELFLSGYPADKTFGTQWTDAEPISGVLTGRLKYMIDTFGGHSGSAVVPVGGSAAVGIHNYGGCPNFCTRITSGVKADLDQWLNESTSP